MFFPSSLPISALLVLTVGEGASDRFVVWGAEARRYVAFVEEGEVVVLEAG